MRRRAGDVARRTAIELARDESGSFGILFAMLLMPMLVLAFAAIDYGSAIRSESRLQSAADSAAAAALKIVGGERSAIEATVRQNLDAQLPDALKGMPFELEIGDKKKSVEVRLETTVPTTVIALAGVTSFKVRVSSVAYVEKARGNHPAIELPRNVPPEMSRAVEELAQKSGNDKLLGDITPEQQEQLRRASEDVERLMRDALSQLGR